LLEIPLSLLRGCHISSASVLYRVCKTPESNMSLRRKVMVPRRPAKYAFVVDEIVKLRSWA